jgi:flagellar protein FlbD
MIKLTRLRGADFVLNCELIETLECTPDTVISIINGKKFIVSESIEEVIEKVVQYKRRLYVKMNCMEER